MPGSLSHLTRRFFDVLFARPLSGSERSAVTAWLPEDVGEAFFSQTDADQRHGYHAALSVVAAGVRDDDVVFAALVHDIGKRHSGLGIMGRSVASILIRLGLPLPEKMAAYRDHGLIGARELAASGAPSLAIDFSIHHHGDRPASIDEHTWSVLHAADQPAKATARPGSRIL